MGQLGFSYIGFTFLLMLFLPNLLWTRYRPAGYSPGKENKLLLVCERVGQVCVTCCALIFSDFNWRPFTPWSLWLIAAIALMLLYECYWIRYFKSKKTLQDFYGSFLGIPAPGATLPVAAFLLLGIYGRVLWLILSVILLGIGHIGIHLQHLQQMKETQP